MLAQVIHRIPPDVWKEARFPGTHTVLLGQTCTALREVVRGARLVAAVRVVPVHFVAATASYDIVALKLEPRAPGEGGADQLFAAETLLISKLPQMSNLARLDINNMMMGIYYASKAFFVTLCAECPGMQVLTLSRNGFGAFPQKEDATCIEYAIRSLSFLRELDLGRNNLNDSDVHRILDSCKHSPSLTELRLAHNDACFDLDTPCDIGSVLRTLDMSSCQVADDDPLHESRGLEQFLKSCTSLTKLDFSDNDLATTHVTTIVNSLACMTALTCLDLSDNGLSVYARRRLRFSWVGLQENLSL